MLKIWGRRNSINVQKVLWCCEELGLDYERIDAGGAFGLTRDPEYLALNPNGLVPTISDDVRCGRKTCGSAPTPSDGWTGSSGRSGPTCARCSSA
jgi:hypothetical protein